MQLSAGCLEPHNRIPDSIAPLGCGNWFSTDRAQSSGPVIFVVVGEVLRVAGALTPFAYALAAVVAITSALSFAEMGARIPTAGGPIDYLERAFHMRWLGSGAGWVLMVANTVSARPSSPDLSPISTVSPRFPAGSRRLPS